MWFLGYTGLVQFDGFPINFSCIGKKQSEEKFILVTMAKDMLEEKFRLKNKKNSGPEVM